MSITPMPPGFFGGLFFWGLLLWGSFFFFALSSSCGRLFVWLGLGLVRPLGQGGRVRTWVSSRWKNPWRPGQLSVEINSLASLCLRFTVLSAVAEAERERIAEVKDRRARGRFLGGVRRSAGGVMVIYWLRLRRQQAAIKRMRKLRAKGISLRAIRDRLGLRGAVVACYGWQCAEVGAQWAEMTVDPPCAGVIPGLLSLGGRSSRRTSDQSK